MPEEIPNLNSDEVSKKRPNPKILTPLLLVVALGLGAFTGYWFAGRNPTSGSEEITGVISEDKIEKGAEFGVKDTENFPDKAIGVIEAGGENGEGTHKLIREGGPSQTVYLTSSVLDLDQFVGKKVEVNGATTKAQKVAWLMDVGKIKVLE
ncbi:hypothetical protein C4578_03185 [Candidatus Microgenomates bacterium]|jgi:hypothetical protein|nr:MAG: hypothetical protein C4578_03185 [Candidatus Microgenomates bacterium]